MSTSRIETSTAADALLCAYSYLGSSELARMRCVDVVLVRLGKFFSATAVKCWPCTSAMVANHSLSFCHFCICSGRATIQRANARRGSTRTNQGVRR